MGPTGVIDPLPIFFIGQPKEKEDSLLRCEEGVTLKIKEDIAISWLWQVGIPMPPGWVVTWLKMSERNRC